MTDEVNEVLLVRRMIRIFIECAQRGIGNSSNNDNVGGRK